MTRGLLLAADGVVDDHLTYAYQRLKEDAVLVDVATPDGASVRTDLGRSRDAIAVADISPSRQYDLVVIPGGHAPSPLAENEPVHRRLADHLDTGGVVCAVAEGILVLRAIGALDGRLVTGPSTIQDDLESAGARPTDEAVTVDGPIVTVRDTNALPFGIAATLGNVAIPQCRAGAASERPHWTAPDSPDR